MSTKFYYFDGRGIGEPIRWIMSYGGIDFEDIRIPYDTFPPNLPQEFKSKSHWGKVPLLEFEGKSLTQSKAIARYLAKKVKLIPEDDYQAALCDEYIDSMRDFLGVFYVEFKKEDSKPKDEKYKESLQSAKTKCLDVLESIISSNGGNYLTGNTITWADLYLAFAVDHFQHLIGIDISEGCPKIKRLKEGVCCTPGIKAWLERRPSTKY